MSGRRERGGVSRSRDERRAVAQTPSALAEGPRVAAVQPPWWQFLVRFWPLLLFSGYLGFTVFVFAFGPVDYPVTNPWATYGFLAAVQGALVIGYVLVPFRVPTARPPRGYAWIFSVPHLMVASAIVNLALLVPSTFLATGSLNVVGALRDPAAAYSRAAANAGSTNPFAYAIILAAPLMALAVPLTLFYWSELTPRLRLVGAATIGVIAAAGILLGRNKGVADLAAVMLVFVMVHAFRRERPWSARRWGLAATAALVILLLFFAFFSFGTLGRSTRLAGGYISLVEGYLDFDNVLLAPFPERAKPGVGLLYHYLTQGYYGLSLSLQLDFVWTRGLGNSYFLHSIEEHVLGSQFARANNYPARVEEAFGYSMLGRWHTIHPWLASDLTFPGDLIFVAVVGALLAVTWRETFAGGNPFAVVVFANLCQMLFYFNANNQVLAFPAQFTATTGTLALWLASRGLLARAQRFA